MAWNYLKQKTAKTPDARRNDRPVKQEKFVKVVVVLVDSVLLVVKAIAFVAFVL